MRPLLLLLALAPPRAAPSSATCIERGSFVDINFESQSQPGTCNGILEHSNLGGLGGRCTMSGAEDLCIQTGAPTATTPTDIRFRGVGTSATGERIDMRITNETEYRGYNTEINGLKRSLTTSGEAGCFAVLNLLAPRTASRIWNTLFTFVQLRVEFRLGSSQAPIALPRTYISFYDFDNSAAGVPELLPLGPQSPSSVRHLPSDMLCPACVVAISSSPD